MTTTFHTPAPGHAMCQHTAQNDDHLLVCFLREDGHEWHYDNRGLGAWWRTTATGAVEVQVGVQTPTPDQAPDAEPAKIYPHPTDLCMCGQPLGADVHMTQPPQGHAPQPASEHPDAPQPGVPNLPAPLGTASGALDLDALEAGVVNLRVQLETALATAVAEMRAARGTVVTQEDTYELVRRLAHAQEVFGQWAAAFTAAGKATLGHIEEELLTGVGEQDGIPTGRMIVPTGGREYVVAPAYRAGTDSWDVHSIVGVVADVAMAEALAPLQRELGGQPVNQVPVDVATEATGNALHKLLGLLASPKWKSTAIDALRRQLAGTPEGDRMAGVLGQARVRGDRVYTGVTVELEEAKARRRS